MDEPVTRGIGGLTGANYGCPDTPNPTTTKQQTKDPRRLTKAVRIPTPRMACVATYGVAGPAPGGEDCKRLIPITGLVLLLRGGLVHAAAAVRW